MMAKARALAVFTVRYGRIKLRVRLLPTVSDVHAECQQIADTRVRGGKCQAYFYATPRASITGVVALPMSGGDLADLIPHEVTHAVVSVLGDIAAGNDEALATAVGMLSGCIRRHIERLGLAP